MLRFSVKTVKFVTVYAIRAYRRSEGIAQLIIISGTRWRRVLILTPRPLCSRVGSPTLPILKTVLLDPLSIRTLRKIKKKKYLTFAGIQTLNPTTLSLDTVLAT